MSLLLTALGVVGAVYVARATARALRGERRPETPKGPLPLDAAPIPAATTLLRAFPCQLGDVILSRHDDEAWLAGALVFHEKDPMAALFIAPDAGGDRGIYARPSPEPLLWLSPLLEGAIEVGPEPPSSLEHDRDRFERVRRLPFRVERIGTGAPDIGDAAIVAEYRAASGARLLVVVGSGPPRAYLGRALEQGTYDVLPGKSEP